MAASAVASQSGRSTRQSQIGTPARNESPTRRGARSGSAAARSTPATRRSTRNTPRNLEQSKDAINNPALPEIQTRQSYAYGSSKAPQLPEQLYARGTMSMQQVADQMNTDIQRAQFNLGETADHQIQSNTRNSVQPHPKQDQHDGIEQSQPRRRQTTPVSQTTEFRKQRRTAAWASSLDESQLDDIAEEISLQDSPETKRTDPSSFPSGIFDHSYAYERGVRAPRAEQAPSSILLFLQGSMAKFRQLTTTTIDLCKQFICQLQQWLSSLFRSTIMAVSSITQSGYITVLWKILIVMSIVACWHLSFCFLYRNAICDTSSNSPISHIMQQYCGACQNTYAGSLNLTASDHANIHKLTTTLNSINSRINSLESKLANRIESKYASIQGEMDALRRQQSDLTGLLENLGQGSDNDIASPLISRINFFAPANGALVNPWYTSPTKSRVQSLPIRIALGVIGLKKYDTNGPATALMPWQDVGDCWCASSSQPGQDSVRLGVEVREMIYPTELVIEHAPAGTTLLPDTAPREVELWADIEHLSPNQRKTLNIDAMRLDGAGVKDPLLNKQGRSFVKFATVEYDATRGSHHVQRFKLDINNTRDPKYSAQMFVVRVRTNHGADYSCMYRIRLHGIPVAENVRQARFAREWIDNTNSDTEA